MSAVPEKIETWQMVRPTIKNKDTGEVKPGKLVKVSIPVPPLSPEEVLVEVAKRGERPS
jgi:6-hydroxycyclohex-1-ene-1-carbonyl-CoA dehydrogenase